MSGVRIVDASIGTSGSALRDAFSAGSGAKITYSVTTAAKADQDALQRAVRAKLKSLPAAGDFQVTASQGFGANSDIEVDITAGTASALDTAAQQVLDAVKGLPQVAQASSNLSATEQYLAVTSTRRRRRRPGYSEVALAQFVARASQPTSIGSRSRSATTSSPSTCRTGTRRRRWRDLAALKVATPTGDKRLDSLATIRTATEAAAITSTDCEAQRRDLRDAGGPGHGCGERGGGQPPSAGCTCRPAPRPASAASQSTRDSAFQQLLLALLAAILIVYTVMVATFRCCGSRSAARVGARSRRPARSRCSSLSGIPLGVASVHRPVMLVGIVVTNAIVLIDLVNQYRERGGGCATRCSTAPRGGSGRS